MKVQIALACLLLAAYGFMDIGADNPIDNLVRQALEAVRKLLKNREPYPVPDMPAVTVNQQDISLTIKSSNVKASKASDFTIDHIENNLFKMWAKFGVTVPSLHLTGDYVASGSVKGKQVSGQGTFVLDVTQLGTTGYVELEVLDYYIQMKTFTVDYSIQDLNFSEEGLSIEGMTQEEVQAMLKTSMLQYFQVNKDFVCSQLAQYIRKTSNGIMQGKSLQQLLDWLKKFINQLF